MNYSEYNFDGLIGPNHNYCGLSFGNLASQASKNSHSSPKQAAKQGLAKMAKVMELGAKQVVLPPNERPDFTVLRQLGFSGSNREILTQAAKTPEILANVCSASAMWCANGATVSPSVDSDDGKVHITSANLNDKFHRAIEAEHTYRILQATCMGEQLFVHHAALPQVSMFGDEGAANHNRFCVNHGDVGLNLFVYGRNVLDSSQIKPEKFPARQTLQASEAIVRLHKLPAEQVIYLQQNPQIVDAGVFHNDVAAIGNRNVYIYHQDAYVNSDILADRLASYFANSDYYLHQVGRDEISFSDAIETYFFNSQLIEIGHQQMALLVPLECEKNKNVLACIHKLIAGDNPITEVIYVDLTQSMRNGGGPACLRLRMVLNEQQAQGINQGSLLTLKLYKQLDDWIERNYRDTLTPNDLADWQFIETMQLALTELTDILAIGPIYSWMNK